MVVGEAINTQLGQGLDANGQFGAALFNDINSVFTIGQRSVGARITVPARQPERHDQRHQPLSTFDYKVTFSTTQRQELHRAAFGR